MTPDGPRNEHVAAVLQEDFVQITILVCVALCLYFRAINRGWIESRKEGVVPGARTMRSECGV